MNLDIDFLEENLADFLHNLFKRYAVKHKRKKIYIELNDQQYQDYFKFWGIIWEVLFFLNVILLKYCVFYNLH